MTARPIHIDDTDPRFTFRGNWAVQQTSDPWGLSGSPFNLTLHQTASDGVVIIRFKNASFLTLYGNIDTLDNRPKPSWHCILDTQVVNATEIPVTKMSHFAFCKFPIKDGGEHQLTMNVTVPTGGILAIDAIALTPATDVTEGETVKIDHGDPTILYKPDNAWRVSTSTDSRDTDTTGSSLQFNFTGTAVEFVAVYQANENQSQGVYSIDGAREKDFVIPAALSTSFNDVLISEKGLSATNHSLNVTFTGQSGNAPLGLGYFFVTLPPGQSPLVSTAEIIDIPDQTTHTKSSKAGAIAGGVVGGVAGLVLIIVALFLGYRYRSRQVRQRSAETDVVPFVENKPPEPASPPASPATNVHPPGSSISHATSGDSKPASGPIVLAYEPGRRVDILHEDSGYRAGDSSASRMDGVEVRDIPPVYSPV